VFPSGSLFSHLRNGALSGELDGPLGLRVIRKHLKLDQRIFVGVFPLIDRQIETPEEVRGSSFRAWGELALVLDGRRIYD
jgi:hypothetical protein